MRRRQQCRTVLNHTLWDKSEYQSGPVKLKTSDLEHSTQALFDSRIESCVCPYEHTEPLTCDPNKSKLSVGLRCKACDASLSVTNDPELCSACLAATQYLQPNKK